jgi:predicted  nucleic acid-binding Zn-ribbon protein
MREVATPGACPSLANSLRGQASRRPLKLYWGSDDTDERLERLTEQHEALTQRRELFQHDMADMRAAAAERDAKTDQRISRVLEVVEKIAERIDKLAAIAYNHERRIEHLEG